MRRRFARRKVLGIRMWLLKCQPFASYECAAQYLWRADPLRHHFCGLFGSVCNEWKRKKNNDVAIWWWWSRWVHKITIRFIWKFRVVAPYQAHREFSCAYNQKWQGHFGRSWCESTKLANEIFVFSRSIFWEKILLHMRTRQTLNATQETKRD